MLIKNIYTLWGITRENAIVEYLDYQIPVTQLMEPKGHGDIYKVDVRVGVASIDRY